MVGWMQHGGLMVKVTTSVPCPHSYILTDCPIISIIIIIIIRLPRLCRSPCPSSLGVSSLRFSSSQLGRVIWEGLQVLTYQIWSTRRRDKHGGGGWGTLVRYWNGCKSFCMSCSCLSVSNKGMLRVWIGPWPRLMVHLVFDVATLRQCGAWNFYHDNSLSI